MFPEADVPVLQVSLLRSLDPEAHIKASPMGGGSAELGAGSDTAVHKSDAGVTGVIAGVIQVCM